MAQTLVSVICRNHIKTIQQHCQGVGACVENVKQ